MIHSCKQKGFTLIELLVAIAIIGLLSSVVLTSLSEARARARDARRKSDLDQIRTALIMYYDTHGDYMETGSGCGYSGNGIGWFNHDYNTYLAMSECLVDEGLTPSEIIDPSGVRYGGRGDVLAYMKYSCSLGTYIYANLETLSNTTTATDGTCCSVCDSYYGMNYYLKI
jgi:prepilin-type N-terminal cleavage/methylation domain-containing protein